MKRTSTSLQSLYNTARSPQYCLIERNCQYFKPGSQFLSVDLISIPESTPSIDTVMQARLFYYGSRTHCIYLYRSIWKPNFLYIALDWNLDCNALLCSYTNERHRRLFLLRGRNAVCLWPRPWLFRQPVQSINSFLPGNLGFDCASTKTTYTKYNGFYILDIHCSATASDGYTASYSYCQIVLTLARYSKSRRRLDRNEKAHRWPRCNRRCKRHCNSPPRHRVFSAINCPEAPT